MRESMFQAAARLGPRIAPTENLDGRLLRGVVHDESARYMGGIAATPDCLPPRPIWAASPK